MAGAVRRLLQLGNEPKALSPGCAPWGASASAASVRTRSRPSPVWHLRRGLQWQRPGREVRADVFQLV